MGVLRGVKKSPLWIRCAGWIGIKSSAWDDLTNSVRGRFYDLGKGDPMKINLKGPDLERYREIRRSKQLFQMPDKRTSTKEPKINLCCLCPRQHTKRLEMNLEGSQ